MTLGRSLVIANPEAKHGVTRSVLPAVTELLDGVVEYDLVLSEAPEHALRLARDASGYDSVIAVGGDGTVHEVLNGLMARPAEDRPAFTLIPTGSGNDYRRTLGISTDISTAVRQIASGERVRMDVGTCNGVYFANSIAVGLDARVTAKAVELKVTTGWSGIWLYARALRYVLFNQYYSHPVTLTIDDGEPHAIDMMIVAITNGPTYGGGFHVTPDAVSDDGLLDVCIVDKVGLPGALWRLPFIVFGKHTWMKPVEMKLVKALRLVSESPVEGQIDGETMLETEYAIGIIPDAIEVVVPAGSRA
jgi:YegS/Rv2252/BmrU family lipid kinase